MSIYKLDEKMLDKIIDKVIDTVSKSKTEIFEISEQSRQEYQQLEKELQITRVLVNETINESDKLEVQVRHARNRLSAISKNFNQFSEEEIRETYEEAHDLHIRLTMSREKEKQLRERRDDLERRLVNLGRTVEKAEALVGQISVVLSYLGTDIRQMNEMLEDARQKQEFGLRIIEAQEEERRRLSREIHDGPAQMLANVMMRSDLIDRIAREKGMEEAIKEVRSLKGMVRSALYEVRKIIYDLRPMALDDLGLIPTLKRYLSTVEEYYKIKINFLNLGKEKRIPGKLEVALFRLIQEAVQNACKHSKSNEIGVKIEIGKNEAIMIVKDDGVGFDVDNKKEQSFGLIGMRERVELLKGELTIRSKLNNGTNIIIKVPIMNE